MSLILKTEMFICQSKANSDVKLLSGRITHLEDPKLRKMPARGMYENENSMFHSGPGFIRY